jgi:hypothetical protein
MKEEQKSNRIGLEQDKAKTPNRAVQTAEMEIKMNVKSGSAARAEENGR